MSLERSKDVLDTPISPSSNKSKIGPTTTTTTTSTSRVSMKGPRGHSKKREHDPYNCVSTYCICSHLNPVSLSLRSPTIPPQKSFCFPHAGVGTGVGTGMSTGTSVGGNKKDITSLTSFNSGSLESLFSGIQNSFDLCHPDLFQRVRFFIDHLHSTSTSTSSNEVSNLPSLSSVSQQGPSTDNPNTAPDVDSNSRLEMYSKWAEILKTKEYGSMKTLIMPITRADDTAFSMTAELKAACQSLLETLESHSDSEEDP